MTFIKKQKLVEEVKEEPVQQTVTESVEDNLQSALLEVVADELSYVAKLNRMIELAEEAGKDDLVSALKSSRASMKSNIAEVYSKGKKILGLTEEESEDEKQEVTEAVDPTKVYDGEKVADIITDFTVDFIGTEAANELEMMANSFESNTDYTAEQIDAGLARYQIDPATLESIEAEISQLPDAKQSRQQEFKSDLDMDLSTLKNIREDLYTYAAVSRLSDLIVGLENIQYDGRPGVVWGKNDWGKGKGAIIS